MFYQHSFESWCALALQRAYRDMIFMIRITYCVLRLTLHKYGKDDRNCQGTIIMP